MKHRYGPGALNRLHDEYGNSLLHCCVLYDSDRCLEILLDKFNLDTELCDSDGSTCLHVAARTGRVEIVRFLLCKDVNVHARARLDYTPLHLAAENSHVEIVRMLLRAGSKVYHHTSKGKLASDLSKNKVVRYILSAEEADLIKEAHLNSGDVS